MNVILVRFDNLPSSGGAGRTEPPLGVANPHNARSDGGDDDDAPNALHILIIIPVLHRQDYHPDFVEIL